MRDLKDDLKTSSEYKLHVIMKLKFMPSVHDDGKRIVYSKCGSKIILTDNIDKIIQEIFEDIREGSVVLDARLKLLKLILCQR